MKTLAKLSLFALLCCSLGNATSLRMPSVYTMKPVNARYGFESITSDVILSISPTKTHMALTYVQGGKDTQVDLVITKTEEDCGSMHYFASLESTPRDEHGRVTGPRYSVHFVDHSARRCRDIKPFKFEATVRMGFGWCGTMDSTMTLQGNPAGLM